MSEQTLHSWILRVGHARDYAKLTPYQVSHDEAAQKQKQSRHEQDIKNKKQKDRMAFNLRDWLNH